MTNIPNDFFSRQFIGFEDIFRALERYPLPGSSTAKSYPPNNVIRLDENRTRLELAVAGFKREHLTVGVENNQLSVTGEIDREDEELDYVFKGISTRNFTRKWTLDRHIEVESVELVEGILRIDLIRNVPKEERFRQLEIK